MSFPEIVRNSGDVRNPSIRTFRIWVRSQLSFAHPGVAEDCSRGVTLPSARYKEIVLGVLIGIKQHGATDVIKYWPGYLKHCLQTHFKVHGEEIYNEAKSVRNKVEHTLLACRKVERSVDPIAVIAEARKLNAKPKRFKRAVASQLNLL